MNQNRLKGAVNKYRPQIEGKSEDEVKELLLADEKQYTVAEADEIYLALIEPPKVTGVVAGGIAAVVEKPSPNDNLDLDQFDYKSLTGENFDDYVSMVDSLPLYENRDFTQYMASGVFEKVFDKNLNPVDKLVGIKINNDTPVNHTRIPVHVAVELNRQIFNRDNPASNSRYYLLKK